MDASGPVLYAVLAGAVDLATNVPGAAAPLGVAGVLACARPTPFELDLALTTSIGTGGEGDNRRSAATSSTIAGGPTVTLWWSRRNGLRTSTGMPGTTAPESSIGGRGSSSDGLHALRLVVGPLLEEQPPLGGELAHLSGSEYQLTPTSVGGSPPPRAELSPTQTPK